MEAELGDGEARSQDQLEQASAGQGEEERRRDEADEGSAVGLAVIGVPLALPLGITAVSAFFPLVGAVAAGTVAALVALLSGGVTDALLVVGLVWWCNR